MHIDNHMNSKNPVEQILPKLGAACFSIRSLIPTLNPNALRAVYFAYFHSVFLYGIIFWRNSTHVHHVFKLQKELLQ